VTRRTIVSGAAALPAVVVLPALTAPTEPDPIFAAIAAHRSAWAALVADGSRLDQEDTPEAEEQLDDIHDAVTEAEELLNESAPTTMAGVRALCRYVTEHEAPGNDWADNHALHRNLANALERLTTSAVVS
jgi:hypothetical protein